MDRDTPPFRDRRDAGRRLSERLLSYRGTPRTVVVGLPRGGVVVAAEIAEALGLPLESLTARGIGLPRGATVILVDDGVANSSAVLPAIRTLRRQGVSRLVLAIPVAPAYLGVGLRLLVDEMIVLLTPTDFATVGEFYVTFPQVSEEDVAALLEPSVNQRRAG